MQSRRENTIHRLADCYLFSSESNSETATNIYRSSYQLTSELPLSQQQQVRPKLLCKRTIALVLRCGIVAEATNNMKTLKSMKLGESQVKAISMYQQIADAFLSLKSENTNVDRQKLRDAIGQIVNGEKKKFSRNEFDLLFLSSNELIRRESESGKPDVQKLLTDIVRLFGIIP